MTKSIIITKAPMSPIPLTVNGGPVVKVPLNKDTEIPDDYVGVLEDAADIEWRFTDEKVEDKAHPTVKETTRSGFNPDSIIDGNIDDVEGRLDDLSAEELDQVRQAEGKAGKRKGVNDAIDARVAKMNEGSGNEG